MSVFPAVVRKITMQHRTHEKDYHQVLIVTGEGNALVINRWGKRGAKGQQERTRFTNVGQAVEALDRKRRDKEKGGYVYDRAKDNSKEAADETEFRRIVGPLYYPELGDHLTFLIPGADTTGVKEPDLPTWELGADGQVVHKGYQPKHIYKEPEPTVEDLVAENEDWGRF